MCCSKEGLRRNSHRVAKCTAKDDEGDNEQGRKRINDFQFTGRTFELVLGLIEPHDLHDADIIIGADNRADNTDDGERIKLRFDGGEEDVILAEEAA